MRIAILTSFADIQPGYSLTGIVEDQISMLRRYGHEVHLFVREQFNRDTATEAIKQAELHDLMPFAHLIDYTRIGDLTPDHRQTAEMTAAMLTRELAAIDVVFTHDLVFTGWNLPYAEAIKQTSANLPNIQWYHWIHSIPTAGRDWWDLKSYGSQHRLVYPNASDAPRVADQYHCPLDQVVVIPHIKDLRSWFYFHSETCRFIDRYPGVMQADIVEVLPASADRLSAKRVDVVIKLFAAFKRRGHSVCLVIANQWATGRQRKEAIDGYKLFAAANGLDPNQEVIFTSDFGPEYEKGLPRRMIRELFQCANLFIFPTREESFGLVVPEAALAGVFPVLNNSLDQQIEISGKTGLYFEFGSYNRPVNHQDIDAWCYDLVLRIRGRMLLDMSLEAKTFARQTYNWDAIYRNHYEPLLAKASHEADSCMAA